MSASSAMRAASRALACSSSAFSSLSALKLLRLRVRGGISAKGGGGEKKGETKPFHKRANNRHAKFECG